MATRQAVVNLTDDATLFVYTSLGDLRPPSIPATQVHGAILADACAAWEVAVEALDLSGERTVATCGVMARTRLRDFIGYNRARSALLEAAILATRLHLLEPEAARRDLERLQTVVDKTGDEPERRAMAFVLSYVAHARSRQEATTWEV